jgi:hypothetical protein
VAGCATSTGSAGHAPAGATANSKLTFHLDHSVGADENSERATRASASLRGAPLRRGKLWTFSTGGPLPHDRASPRASQLDTTLRGRIMCAALHRVGALSLLTSSRFSRDCQLPLFHGSKKGSAIDPRGIISITPDELVRFRHG